MSHPSTSASDRLYPGCLVKVNPGPDHGAQARINAGKIGIVIRHMAEKDGVSSSPNVWQVVIEGKSMNFHALDLTPMTDE